MGFFSKKNSKSKLGVQLLSGKAYAAVYDGEKIIDYYTSENVEDDYKEFSNWVKSNHYNDLQTFICLNSQQYEEFLIDAPELPDDAELKDVSNAIALSARDLFTPSHEYDIQGFKLPKEAFRGRKKMAVAIGIKKSTIEEKIDVFHRLHCPIEKITVTKLAILNLSHYFNPEGTIGVINLNNKIGELYFYYNSSLYIKREFDIGIEKLFAENQTDDSTQQMLDQLALDIQRSADYVESQVGLPPLSQIWVMPPNYGDFDSLLLPLEERLGLNIRQINLKSLLADKAEQAIVTASLASAIGVLING